MKLPKGYFSNLSASKFREQLKLLPAVKQENVRVIYTLMLTFFAMSFFGIFAIKPTLSTIVSLKRQLADSELINEKLGTKIKTLSSLQSQYANLQPQLATVLEAIPTRPEATTLTGQILSLAQSKNVTIISLETSNVILVGKSPSAELPSGSLISQAPVPSQAQPARESASANATSFTFSLQAQGSYENLMSFAKTLAQINRIITITSLSLNKNPKADSLIIGMNGTAYFQK